MSRFSGLHSATSADDLVPIGICSLVSQSLSTHDNYTALPTGYVWGSRIPAQYVLLNGRELEVTPNLASALTHMQSGACDVAPWIDALCINQANVLERHAQVARMDVTYARNVVAYLDSATEESDSLDDGKVVNDIHQH